jgi:hypothetical protein
MTQAFTWKHLGIVFASIMGAGVCCLVAGNAGAATGLFVVGMLEGAAGSIYVAIKRA